MFGKTCKFAVNSELNNARLNYLQQETTHIMENAIFNELCIRGFSVDVGVVKMREIRGGKEIHFPTKINFKYIMFRT